MDRRYKDGCTSRRTILGEDVETFLDRQTGVEHDESKAERKDVIAIADLEELPYSPLQPTATSKERKLVPSHSLVCMHDSPLATTMAVIRFKELPGM